MDALRQYAVSLVTAAILCSILTGILHKGISKELLKITCGAFLAFTLIRPLLSLKTLDFSNLGLSYTQKAAEAAALGADYSTEAMSVIIKEETEAYILDKAADLNLVIRVEVTLSADTPPVPTEVRLSGDAAPLARQKLEETITNDLGIAKENLLWIG